jgi:hypothetical protein
MLDPDVAAGFRTSREAAMQASRSLCETVSSAIGPQSAGPRVGSRSKLPSAPCLPKRYILFPPSSSSHQGFHGDGSSFGLSSPRHDEHAGTRTAVALDTASERHMGVSGAMKDMSSIHPYFSTLQSSQQSVSSTRRQFMPQVAANSGCWGQDRAVTTFPVTTGPSS